MKTFVILALCVAAVLGEEIRYGFPSFQVSPYTGRVVGGKEATPHSAPYIVSIKQFSSHSCGGSIMTEKVVLTAAHCLSSTFLVSVVAGLHDVSSTSGSQSRSVSRIIKHEKYGGNVGPYDIGLIVVSSPFTFTANVQPITLPMPDVIHEGDAVLYGWGSTSTSSTSSMPRYLMTVTKPIVEYKTCEDHLGGPGASPLDPLNICMGPLDAPISACSGDSGGPLVQENNGKSELIGIVSWGYMPCGTPDKPSVYTRTSAFIDWIDAKLATV